MDILDQLVTPTAEQLRNRSRFDWWAGVPDEMKRLVMREGLFTGFKMVCAHYRIPCTQTGRAVKFWALTCGVCIGYVGPSGLGVSLYRVCISAAQNIAAIDRHRNDAAIAWAIIEGLRQGCSDEITLSACSHMLTARLQDTFHVRMLPIVDD